MTTRQCAHPGLGTLSGRFLDFNEPRGFGIRLNFGRYDKISTHETFICLKGIAKTYSKAGARLGVLDGINLSINSGESCAILGESGSGKSTLLNILGLLDLPDSGEYRFAGHDVFHASTDQLAALRNQKIGFVFQSFNLLPRLSALDNVALPLSYRGISRRKSLQQAMAVLEWMNLAERSQHRPAELSGGQRQRVAIARALVGEPSVILADEPTGNLDSDTAREIVDLLLELNRSRHMTLIVVTHDPLIAARLGRQIRVQNGTLYEAAT